MEEIKPVYLDYMSTTPLDSRVLNKMLPFMQEDGMFGNPASSTHIYGIEALQAVETARAQVADLIGANTDEIVWTSGATESDNLAIIGGARFYKRKGMHVITMDTEHKAVLDSCDALEKEGFEVSYLKPEKNGILSLEVLKDAIREDTILVSVMQVNNEIGVIQNTKEIGELLKDKGILFHVDAAQSAGKVEIDVNDTNIDLLSLSGHKLYGPKGIGALYVRKRPRVRLQALIFGGGHEGGMRSGTLATHQIIGMGEAFAIAKQDFEKDKQHIIRLRDRLLAGIKGAEGISINGDIEQRIPGNLNLCFAGIDGESLLLALRNIAVSSSSACSSASVQPSYVLKSIGLTDERAFSSVRLSFGRFSKDSDIDMAITTICKQIPRLREISAL